jgi:hypothetical protein
MNNNEKSDFRELILRHDERMNELQKNGDEHRKQFNEFMTWAKTHAAEVNVPIARVDRESAEHRARFNEFMKWAKESKEETRKEFDEKIANMQAFLLEAQMRSDERMTRIEKNLEKMTRSRRNGENERE